MPESLLHPVSFVDRAGHRRLPARRARRDDPEEHRPGRPRPRRAGARAADLGRSSPCCGRSIVVINAIAAGVLRLLGRAADGRGAARRTPARRSPPSSRSRAARGCSRPTSTTGWPARSASPRSTVAAVLMPPETLTTVRRGLDGRPTSRRSARPPATAGSRSPATTASCSATCTSRTCWRPTRPGAQRADRATSGSGRSRRCSADDASTTRWRRCSAAARTWRRVVDDDGRTLGPGHPRGRHRGAGRRDPRRGAPRRVGAGRRVAGRARVESAWRRRRTVPAVRCATGSASPRTTGDARGAGTWQDDSTRTPRVDAAQPAQHGPARRRTALPVAGPRARGRRLGARRC